MALRPPKGCELTRQLLPGGRRPRVPDPDRPLGAWCGHDGERAGAGRLPWPAAVLCGRPGPELVELDEVEAAGRAVGNQEAEVVVEVAVAEPLDQFLVVSGQRCPEPGLDCRPVDSGVAPLPCPSGDGDDLVRPGTSPPSARPAAPSVRLSPPAAAAMCRPARPAVEVPPPRRAAAVQPARPPAPPSSGS